jgi:DNA segregation ATPase FtsK/SpoIIIE-like protein
MPATNGPADRVTVTGPALDTLSDAALAAGLTTVRRAKAQLTAEQRRRAGLPAGGRRAGARNRTRRGERPEVLAEAAARVIEDQAFSVSMLMRELHAGHGTAAALAAGLMMRGIISAGGRVLVPRDGKAAAVTAILQDRRG